MCFDYDDGYPEFSETVIVTARKPHRCRACRGEIQPGDRYERHTGKFDGDFYSDPICRRCCYDTVRVVEHELAEGCRWHEAWPAYTELVEYLTDSGMGQTRPEDVPVGFKVGDQPRKPVAMEDAR